MSGLELSLPAMAAAAQHHSLFENTQIAFSRLSDKELKQAHRLFQSFSNPVLSLIGKGLTQLAFQFNLPVEGLLKNSIYRQFCGGESLDDCRGVILHLADHQIGTALQYSVESKTGEDDYNRTLQELLDAIYYAENNSHVKVVCCKLTGIGSLELFEKIQANESLSGDEERAYEHIHRRVDSICSAAEKAGVSVFFDAEESWIQRPFDEMIDEMMLRYNRQRAVVYNTFQLYLTDRLDFLKSSFQKAKDNHVILGAKLVRGAYMEKERERAKKGKYRSPIHHNKSATDNAFNEALNFCVENISGISVCAATHNEQSCRHLANLIDEKNIPRNHPQVFFSQLYGMGEHLTYNLAKAGYNATKLVPYGPVREAIPYLIRRAEENSSLSGQVGRELQLIERELKRRKFT